MIALTVLQTLCNSSSANYSRGIIWSQISSLVLRDKDEKWILNSGCTGSLFQRTQHYTALYTLEVLLTSFSWKHIYQAHCKLGDELTLQKCGACNCWPTLKPWCSALQPWCVNSVVNHRTGALIDFNRLCHETPFSCPQSLDSFRFLFLNKILPYYKPNSHSEMAHPLTV